MNCHEYDDAILDLGRGAVVDAEVEDALRAHARSCPACATRLQQQVGLTAALRALAEADSGAHAPSSMESRLLDRLAASSAPAGPTDWRHWMAIAAVLVAAVGAAVGWLARERTTAIPPASEVAADFVPWPGAAALPAFESGQLVRTELPASVLPLLGITGAHVSREGRVAADLLIGQDGMVRAVRLAPTGGQP
jgi:hypothetical protein